MTVIRLTLLRIFLFNVKKQIDLNLKADEILKGHPMKRQKFLVCKVSSFNMLKHKI